MVTGGAGYIGAHVVRLLAATGPVVVVDDLSTGSVARVGEVPLIRLDVAAADATTRLRQVIADHGVDAVVHLAARKSVAESVARPAWYYEQNVAGLAHVLQAAGDAGVERVVFSSSAAVYGRTEAAQVTEDAPTDPANPYGETKLAGEWLVRAAGAATGMRHVSLRYFNVAGAGWPDLGDPALTNLVTIALDRWRRGEPVVVHGTDYPTADGSGVRDYVHVMDLARAHASALEYLDQPDRPYDVLNLGTGRGTSVLAMLEALGEAGPAGAVEHGPRRAGDPPQVVADPSRAHAVLRWRAEHGVREIAESARAAAAAARV